MRRKKRTSYKFTEKTHSKRGMRSLGIALISIVVGIFMIVISFRNGGNASVYIGSGGIFSFMLSLVALVEGIRSLREEDSYKIFPGVGTFFSAVAFLGWLAVYITGFLI
ncbi:DUF6142 family protein [Roseburia sp. 499]|uniref:DUF6142 family protein n=1 Tax=Roseburia sp. 499 TaxID=1261634 RepID=UPI000952A80A|nr:DUF6142 family protein [Roseburia sp. 499]WVK69174.1 DUF6142 family protein [Roseburia sp. 499]